MWQRHHWLVPSWNREAAGWHLHEATAWEELLWITWWTKCHRSLEHTMKPCIHANFSSWYWSFRCNSLRANIVLSMNTCLSTEDCVYRYVLLNPLVGNPTRIFSVVCHVSPRGKTAVSIKPKRSHLYKLSIDANTGYVAAPLFPVQISCHSPQASYGTFRCRVHWSFGV
jgi:hypothetical protein